MSRKQHSGDFFSIMEQEEYVWAMRTSVNEQKLLEEQEEEMEDEDDEKVTLFDREEGTMNMLLVYKTTILASFVPDEIIFNLNDYTSKTFDASILCGDVSGFTELCETYNQIGSGGPSRLTDMLNNFIGAMVQEIMSHGGDVIKFSGDAFLALWRCSQSYAMRDYIQEAINCALVIQKSHNNFITDVGVTLRVKLAISSGAILFSLIGDSLLSHYIEVGQPILDTKDILEICHAGDIIISEKAYAYVDVSAYLTEEVSGGKYIRIFGVGASWRQIQKFSTHSRYATPSKFLEETDSDASSSSRESLLKRRQSSEFALRPMVNEAATNAKNLYEHLKKFIIPPVMQRIELDEPLEHLTELRQITVIMINIVPHSITFDSLIGLVKRIYRIITIHIQKFSGCINKVSCFDKDLMCVLIFGLRGLKQDLECRNALRCAGLIYEDIYVLSKVKGVSIGVSTVSNFKFSYKDSNIMKYFAVFLWINLSPLNTFVFGKQMFLELIFI
ncbi:hypothetical protein HHI36_002375 [Cryptolaemus montrouzieri]|uniref:Guanylate cyclase domain-containing protein n=1 Tax=Cryptolaemus montrouzieri TaxID=559131 RepID=A0ABD2PAT2_9CUCU